MDAFVSPLLRASVYGPVSLVPLCQLPPAATPVKKQRALDFSSSDEDEVQTKVSAMLQLGGIWHGGGFREREENDPCAQH